MKRARTVVLALLAAVVGFTGLGAAQVEAATTYAITISLFDVEGNPVAGATLLVSSGSSSAQIAREISPGMFRVSRASGTWWYEVVDGEYVGETGEVAVTGSAVARSVEVDRYGTISGHVTNQAGAPLRYVSVRASQFPARGAVTDSNGDYTICCLPNGDYRLKFTDGLGDYADGYGTGQQTQDAATMISIELNERARAEDAVLAASSTPLPDNIVVQGHVVDHTGAPIAAAQVMVEGAGGWGTAERTNRSGYYYVTTDYLSATGPAELIFTWQHADEEPGEYGYEQRTKKVTVPASPPAVTVNAQLRGLGRVSGTVRNSTGTLLQDGYVDVYDQAGRRMAIGFRWIVTGRFGFDLPLGNYRLRVVPPTRYIAEWFNNKTSYSTATPINLVANQTTTLPGITVATKSFTSTRLFGTSPRRHRVRLVIRTTASPSRALTGKVTIRRGTTVVKRGVALVDGQAVVRLYDQPSGKRTYRATYAGSPVTRASTSNPLVVAVR